MKNKLEPVTVTLTNDPAKAVRIMSRVLGQSHDKFFEMIFKKFFLDQVEHREDRVMMIAELLSEIKFPNPSEAEEASHRLEAFASVYGPKNPKDLRIRTGVIQYQGKNDWGVICDYQLHKGSWLQVGFNHRRLIGEPVSA